MFQHIIPNLRDKSHNKYFEPLGHKDLNLSTNFHVCFENNLWNFSPLVFYSCSFFLYSAVCLLLQSNIGLVLHGVMEYDLSLRFLENALAINSKYHGSRSLKVALRYEDNLFVFRIKHYFTGM